MLTAILNASTFNLPDRFIRQIILDQKQRMARIFIEQVNKYTSPESLLSIFNTNLDYLKATGMQQPLNVGVVARILYEETYRENSRCCLIRLAEKREIIGLVFLVAPLPGVGVPWIGLVLIDGNWQRRGLGTESVYAIEAMLKSEGWAEARLSVLKSNPGALRFWEKQAYQVIEEREDQDRRPVWVMGKTFTS